MASAILEGGNDGVAVAGDEVKNVGEEVKYFPNGQMISDDGAEDASGIKLPCGHFFVFKPGEEIYLSQVFLCEMPLVKRYPCGFELILKCFEHSVCSSDIASCPLPCHKPTICGHPCPLNDKCHFIEDSNHTSSKYRCRLPCVRTLCLKMLHKVNCNGDHECYTCLPCQGAVEHKLDCGHFVTTLCSEQSPQESGFICQEKCIKKRPNCDHPCEGLCGEECGNCMKYVVMPYPSCPYRHSNAVLCWQKDQAFLKSLPCDIKMPPIVNKPSCGHLSVRVPCFKAAHLSTAELNLLCREPCNSILKPCGHRCSGTCGECFQGRFHKLCMQECGRVLICNHLCSSPCGAGCPPCKLPCIRKCPHKQCKEECGVLCRWECKEECVYRCEHGSCTQLCGEVCNKEPCNEPCPYTLTCGHACMGFCGEPCPPYCFHCSKDSLETGAIMSMGEVNETDKFLFLEECGHAVESFAMEQWMEQETSDGEILPFRCPVCRTRMVWMHRYSRLMDENWKLVDSVKARIIGNEDDVETVLEDAGITMKSIDSLIAKTPEVHIFCPKVLTKAKMLLDVNQRSTSITSKEANFLWWLLIHWKFTQECFRRFADCRPIVNEMAVMEEKWSTLFEFLLERDWPLQRVEVNAFSMEWTRLSDFTSLYDVIQTCFQKNEDAFVKLFYGELGQDRYSKTEKPLKTTVEYDSTARGIFLEEFWQFQSHMKVTVAVPEAELRKIVNAIAVATGEPGTGRWFKCRNGHTYVVTECGGVMERGTCIECREDIGGARHVLDDGNFLAPEMDGANEAMYDARVRANMMLVHQEMQGPN